MKEFIQTETAPAVEQEAQYRPKIEFGVDKKTDLEMYMMFWRSGLHKLDALAHLENVEDEEAVFDEAEKYFDAYYKEHGEEIKTRTETAERDWELVEDDFYCKTDAMFHDFPWPKGDYKGVASILSMFPRDIEGKFFTFPVNPAITRKPTSTVAHEMLHFLEYDYLQKQYGLKPSESYDEDSKFWQFTENLNVLIENGESWKEFKSGERESKPYPDCEDLYKRMKEIWDKNKNIDNLIREIFKEELTGVKEAK